MSPSNPSTTYEIILLNGFVWHDTPTTSATLSGKYASVVALNLHRHTGYYFRIWSTNMPTFKYFTEEGCNICTVSLRMKSLIFFLWSDYLSYQKWSSRWFLISRVHNNHIILRTNLHSSLKRWTVQYRGNMKLLLFYVTSFVAAFLLFIGLSRIWI